MKNRYILKITAMLLLLASVSGACAQSKIVRLTRYEGKPISGVSVSNAFNVQIIKSDDTKAVLEVSEELEKYLQVSLSNGVLKVGMDSGKWPREFYNKKSRTMKLTVYLPTFNSLNAAGAVTINTTGEFESDNMKINISGASTLKGIKVSAGNLVIDCLGASTATITAVNSGKVKCSSSGASTTKLEVYSGSADLSSVGASTLTVTGKVADAKLSSVGASTLRGSELECKKVKASSVGASNCSVWAVEGLDASASGASNIKYKGSPTLYNTHSAGASSVKKIN